MSWLEGDTPVKKLTLDSSAFGQRIMGSDRAPQATALPQGAAMTQPPLKLVPGTGWVRIAGTRHIGKVVRTGDDWVQLATPEDVVFTIPRELAEPSVEPKTADAADAIVDLLAAVDPRWRNPETLDLRTQIVRRVAAVLAKHEEKKPA